ncbi:hypothetical protein SAMN04487926_14534 [Paraburkholderia steynii]|uniref:Uncharacterized protein n=2 Tax=Paraburkholderia steynii TaxID=1245441 RepID=A0A7Z7BJ54_9BURK|nr:hypothetical protein SAMN04487926_14534 [Paraburkholderia steynii]
MLERELIALLERADLDSTVLFLDGYADLSEVDEVFDVIVPVEEWTHEQGKHGGAEYSVRYPDAFEPCDEEYTDVTHVAQRVALITNGPTNYRRRGLSERQGS